MSNVQLIVEELTHQPTTPQTKPIKNVSINTQHNKVCHFNSKEPSNNIMICDLNQNAREKQSTPIIINQQTLRKQTPSFNIRKLHFTRIKK